jgi:hypothetical protein
VPFIPVVVVLREQLDGTVGTDAQSSALTGHDRAFWAARHAKIEQAARAARESPG